MANTYRVRVTAQTSGSAVPGVVGKYVPEYSQDSGTTWKPTHPIGFESLIEAQQALGFVVENEANFNAQVAKGALAPTLSTVAYP